MEVLAEVERSGFVESRHLGAVAVADADGRLLAGAGDPDWSSTSAPAPSRSRRWPCAPSASRPSSAWARWPWPGPAAHNGEPDHVASVRKVLEAAGLDETALRCPPVLPTDRTARARVDGPAAVYHNCSGKHAYMLAGSVVRGWAPSATPARPLQAVVGDTLSDFAGAAIEHVGVDGCGVPVHAMSLRGLATAYARLGARAGAGDEGPAAVVEAVRRTRSCSRAPASSTPSWSRPPAAGPGQGGRRGHLRRRRPLHRHRRRPQGPRRRPRARAAALLAALRALDWLDDTEWDAVIASATVEIHGGGRPVGAVRPAKLTLATPE